MNCTSLSTLNLPATLSTVGDAAFYGCTALTMLTIPDGDLVLNGQRTYYVSRCFANCDGLTSVTIGDNVILGYSVFDGCHNITTATIGNVVANHNLSSSFVGPVFNDSQLESITFNDNVTFIPSYICASQKKLNSVEIPDGVIQISSCAFEGCTGLTAISLPHDLKEISNGAFKGCTALTEITFPQHLERIESEAFYGCSNLQNISFQGDELKTVLMYAFENCTSLTEAFLPNSVSYVEPRLFYGCTSLKRASIPAGLGTSVGNMFQRYSFTYCPLEEIYCYMMSDLELLNLYNFAYGPSSNEWFDNNTFQTATLYVPKNYKDIYSQAQMWQKFVNIQEMEWDAITDVECSKTPANVRYFNLAGVESAEPQQGVNIKETTYSDGSRKSEKVVIP